ncbi:retrotransposon gag domain, retroviral aspartyl protease [Tanacetum coccineum]
MEFPKFQGGDPRGWILKVEKYFRYYETPDESKVEIASMYLEGDALDLFACISAEHNHLYWEELVKILHENYGPAEFQNPDEHLCNIKQTGTVQEYRQEFAKRVARVHDWRDHCLLGVFISGLKEESVLGSTAEVPPSDIYNTAEISFHAILGKTSGTTMKVQASLVKRLGLDVSTVPSFGVQIGNGQIIQCNQICRGLSDLVLGIKWLASLNTVQANWNEMFMIFYVNGKKYKLQGVPSVAKTDVSLQSNSKLPDATSDSRTRVEIPGIQSILSVYQDVFADVNTLPPNRSHTHYITLLPNSTPPNIRPYRYPYDQKAEIEAQVNELLTCGFVRPSSSPFAGPVLLVKKKDESWRFCIDYRKLKPINKDQIEKVETIPR